MNILLTGYAGGIGSTLLPYLLTEYKVFVVDANYDPTYIKHKNILGVHTIYLGLGADSLNLETLFNTTHRCDFDCIIHLAAMTSLPECEENVFGSFQDNVCSTQFLLRLAERLRIPRFVFASSSAVYDGLRDKGNVLTEESATNPVLNYALHKKMSEDMCMAYAEKFGIDMSILRFFNVYGPNQNITRKSPPLVNYIVREFFNQRVPLLHSDGLQTRDYIHVNYVCQAIIEAMHRNVGCNVYNICSGEGITVREIVDVIMSDLNVDKSLAPVYTNAANFWQDYDIHIDRKLIQKEVNKTLIGSFRKAHEKLKWCPKHGPRVLIPITARQIWEKLSTCE